jgi:hypothetical protein
MAAFSLGVRFCYKMRLLRDEGGRKWNIAQLFYQEHTLQTAAENVKMKSWR